MRTILCPRSTDGNAAAEPAKHVGPLSETELDAVVGAGGPNSGGVGSGGGGTARSRLS